MSEIFGISGDLLAASFNARLSQNAARVSPSLSGASRSASASSSEVTPPWDVRSEITSMEELRRRVLATGSFFTPIGESEFSNIDAPDDQKYLFELHQGLKRLASLVEEAKAKETGEQRRNFLASRFETGLEQFEDFFNDLDLEGVSLLKGEKLSKIESDVAIKRGLSEYTTGVIHKGDFDAEVASLAGDVQFTISVTKNGVKNDIAIDLAGMGGDVRNLDNIAAYINTQLEAAGMITTFDRVKIGEEDDNGIVQGDEYGFKISGVSTEKVEFSATRAGPAVYLTGTSGIGERAGGQLVKFTDIASGAPSTEFTKRLEADPTETEVEITGADGETETRTKTEFNPLEVRASVQAADGGVIVLGETSSTTAGQTLKGESDLVLRRYDTTGKEVWTRVLGAASDAKASSITVADNGDIVIAGSAEGATGDGVQIGGSDSFVAKFSSDGVEQWLKRFGGTRDDSPASVAIDAAGNIFVAGKAESAFGDKAYQGGASDGYVRAYDTDGNILYTRNVGAAGEERIASVSVADDGDLILASVEDGEAVIRKFAAADGDSAAIWEQSLGALDDGEIGAVAIDGNDIYIAGSAGAAFAPMAMSNAYSGGVRDAFLVKMTDGASPSLDYTSFVGSGEDEAAQAIAVNNGKVYLAGKTMGQLSGATQIGERDSFLAELDAADGSQIFATQIGGRAGVGEATGVIVDPQGDSILDALGLPQGALVYADSRVVTDRSSAREGDHFYLSVNGGRRKKITLAAGDTMRSLSFKVNSALVLDGTADVRRGPDGDQLRIKPGENNRIELFAGADGEDLLKSLGVNPGAVVDTVSRLSRDSTSDAPELFALELPNEWDLTSVDGAEAAYEALENAMNAVRRAYRDLTTPPELKALLDGEQKGRTGGTVPAYLTAQIANYQAGLDRLFSGPQPGAGAFF